MNPVFIPTFFFKFLLGFVFLISQSYGELNPQLSETFIASELLNTHGPDFGKYLKSKEDIIFAKKILVKIINRPASLGDKIGLEEFQYEDFRLRAISEYGNFVSKDNSGEWIPSDAKWMNYLSSLAEKNLSGLEAYAVFGALAATGSLQGAERLYSFFLMAQTKALQATLMGFIMASMAEHPVYELKRTKSNQTMIFSLPFAPHLSQPLKERDDRDQWKTLISQLGQQLVRLKKESHQESLLKLYENYEHFLQNTSLLHSENKLDSVKRGPSSMNGTKEETYKMNQSDKAKRSLASQKFPDAKPSNAHSPIAYFIFSALILTCAYLVRRKWKK
ncbi:MAG: hypothetical protein QE271_02200 [Bacteriovoracaceae bacterium]|nr:hypothetical protein [Bacteriovoracaceae bacterium]